MEQVVAIDLDLPKLRSDWGETATRFFVRAHAETSGGQSRYAYTNPVWAMTRSFDECPGVATDASDGDGLADGCDPCPNAHRDQSTVQCTGDRPTDVDGSTSGSSGGGSDDDPPSSGGTTTAPAPTSWYTPVFSLFSGF